MWPKMLIELLPHLSRLVPMWDKFLSSRAANDKAAEAAMNTLAEEVRGDLGQITSAHAALYRQLQDQNAQIAALGEEVRHARLAAERAEATARLVPAGVAAMTNSMRRLAIGVAGVGVLAAISIVLQLVARYAH